LYCVRALSYTAVYVHLVLIRNRTIIVLLNSKINE
jgi:hypothetical protein